MPADQPPAQSKRQIEVELCRDCEGGRSTRPLIECQHIGPDEAGAVIEFVRADAAAALLDFTRSVATGAWAAKRTRQEARDVLERVDGWSL